MSKEKQEPIVVERADLQELKGLWGKGEGKEVESVVKTQ